MNKDDYITINTSDTIDLSDPNDDQITITSSTGLYNNMGSGLGASPLPPLSTTLSGNLSWGQGNLFNGSYSITGAQGATTASSVLTTNGASGLNWATLSVDDNLTGATLKVKGDADFDGDIKVQGVSLSKRLDKIEERLGILRPNNDLEGRWEKLKALGEEYRKLEKEILEGEQIWDILKK